MEKILETKRLYLREMVIADAPEAYALNSDLEVIKYTGDVAFRDVAEAAAFLTNYKDYQNYGVGRWAVIRTSDEAWLGWCGLKILPESAEIDLGYRLHKRYWNQGYATEAALACLWYGFEKMNYQTIIGRVSTANAASVKVLENVGMQYWKEASFHGEEGLYFKADRPW